MNQKLLFVYITQLNKITRGKAGCQHSLFTEYLKITTIFVTTCRLAQLLSSILLFMSFATLLSAFEYTSGQRHPDTRDRTHKDQRRRASP